MLKYDVIILPLAEKDISNNTDYIFYDKEAPDTALKLLEGFKDTIVNLSFMPERHDFDEDKELAALQIRKCYYKNYKIFFYVNKEEKNRTTYKKYETGIEDTYGEGEGRVYESDEDPLDLYSPVEGKIEIKIR